MRTFESHPTLEPTVVEGNWELVRKAVSACCLQGPEELRATIIDELFGSESGRRRKGEFAYELAAQAIAAQSGNRSC